MKSTYHLLHFVFAILLACGISAADDTVPSNEMAAITVFVYLEGLGPAAEYIVPVTASPTNSDTLTFNVNFSEPVRNFDNQHDIAVMETGAVIHAGALITGGPQNYTVDITGTGGDGTMALSVRIYSDIQDVAGNPLSLSVTSPAVTVDNTPPTLSIGPPFPAGTETGPVRYEVTYDGAHTVTLAVNDITLNEAGLAAGTVTQVTGFGSTLRTVTVGDISGDGKLKISVAAGTASDLAGNLAKATGLSENITVGDAIWVDFAASDGGDGSIFNPFNRLQDAIDAANPWGTLRIYGGTTDHVGSLTKPMWIESANQGNVRIGLLSKTGLQMLDKNTSNTSGANAEDAENLAADEEINIAPLLDALRLVLLENGGNDTRVSGEAAASGNLTTYEPVFPFTMAGASSRRAQVDSVLAIRLRSEREIDPGTIRSPVTGYAPDEVTVEWRPAQVDDLSDVWVIIRPRDTWYLEDVIAITAGAETFSGDTVGPVTHEFRVESGVDYEARMNEPADSIMQPQYDEDFDASGLDLGAESNDTAVLTEADEMVLSAPLNDGVDAPFMIGPERVYDVPQRVWLPLPQGLGPNDVRLYYYHPHGEDRGWFPAENIEGWLVPGSTLYLDMNGSTYLGFLVNHAGIVQLSRTAMNE